MKKILLLLVVLLNGCGTIYLTHTNPDPPTYITITKPSADNTYYETQTSYPFPKNSYSTPHTRVTKKVKRVIRIYKVTPANGGGK